MGRKSKQRPGRSVEDQRKQKELQHEQTVRLFLARLGRRLTKPKAKPAYNHLHHRHDDSEDDKDELRPPNPSQIGGDWSDRSIPAPPRQTFALNLRNKPEPELSVSGGPVRSLASLAADVVARHLDEFDETLWTDSEGGMSIEVARLVVRALQSGGDGPLDQGNWIRFVGGYGASVLPPLVEDMVGSRSSQASPLEAAHAQLHVPYKELLHTLLASPPTSALLQLNNLAHFQPQSPKEIVSAPMPLSSPPSPRALPSLGHVLSVLDLSDTTFADADCRAIKDLCFLTALTTDRTQLSDAGIRFLTSALYVAPSSSPDGPLHRKGLHNLRAWSLVGCGGVTDRAATSLKAWLGLCYIDIRRTSATPSAFLQILNRRPESAPLAPPTTAQSNATKFALASPPEAKSSLLVTLLAAPERFPFLTASFTGATCTITTQGPSTWPRPGRSSRPRAKFDGLDEFAEPASLKSEEEPVERPRGLVPTPLGRAGVSKVDDVVLLRRAPSAQPLPRPSPSVDLKRKVPGAPEVAQIKRRRSEGFATPDRSTGLWGAILGHAAASPVPSTSSPATTGHSKTPLRPSLSAQSTSGPKGRPLSSPPIDAPSYSLPPPVALSARPFQPPLSLERPASGALSSFAPVRSVPRNSSATDRGVSSKRSLQPSASLPDDGFATARPSARAAKIGDGGRALKGTGSIFRGAKWT